MGPQGVLGVEGLIPCGSLWQPVPPNRSGLDPPNIKISDSGGLDLEAWMPECWKDLNGLEGVTEVTEVGGC